MGILKSVFFGLLLIVAAAILLFWAEGRAVGTARALEEGAGIVVSADAAKIDPANDGRLVHISGDAVGEGIPADTRFGIKADGAMRLVRKVEMLQWKEVAREVERTGTDGKTVKSTVYDYEKVWSSSPINSSNFKAASAPKNPPMPVQGDTFDVMTAKVGAFVIAGNEVAPLSRKTPLPLSDAMMRQAAAAFGDTKPMWLVNDMVLSAADPDSPQIGDTRIGYERGDVTRVSAVGKQQGDRLIAYTTSNGRDVFLIQNGQASAEAMFKDAVATNVFVTWLIRGGGLILMFVGFLLTFMPLTATLGRVPLIGPLVSNGAALIAVILTLLLGGLVIGLGWIFFRPVPGHRDHSCRRGAGLPAWLHGQEEGRIGEDGITVPLTSVMPGLDPGISLQRVKGLPGLARR